MKNFHQNLLIFFALALCGLCAAQWYRETGQRNQIENLDQQLSQKLSIIQDSTNTIRIQNDKISQMDANIAELRSTIKTNEQLILSEKRQLNEAEMRNEALTNAVEEYKNAIAAYQAKFKEIGESIKQQNAVLQQLVTQRDQFVEKLNASIKDRNDIVGKYNELVARVEKMQASATNKQVR